jgi:hypothetical protein
MRPDEGCGAYGGRVQSAARKRNRFVGIEFSNLLTSDALQILCGESPRLRPLFAKRDCSGVQSANAEDLFMQRS